MGRGKAEQRKQEGAVGSLCYVQSAQSAQITISEQVKQWSGICHSKVGKSPQAKMLEGWSPLPLKLASRIP